MLQSFNYKKKNSFNLLLSSAETWNRPKLGLISQSVVAPTSVLSVVFAPRGC